MVNFGSSARVSVWLLIASGFVMGGPILRAQLGSRPVDAPSSSEYSKAPSHLQLGPPDDSNDSGAKGWANSKGYHGSVGPYLPLNVLWRIRTGGGDRTITADPIERDAYPLDGAIFYVSSADHEASTVPLYRLFNGSDHMVSLDPNEGAGQGYRVEGILGYPFLLQQPGTSELIRTYNASTGHHSLRNSTGLETEKGYSDEPLGVYGYPRYYNLGKKLLSLTGGGVTVDSNEVAGGSLWQLTWNGTEIINNWDYGRQTQTDIFPFDYANPTEAGDTWSNDPVAAINHGSPLGLAENDGLTQRTRSIALEYDPDGTQQCYYQPPVGPCPGFGGGADNPVVWRDVILGKDLTLDFNGLGPVALYSTFMEVPRALASGTAREIPVIYARANFYRMFTYDAEGAQLKENPCSNGSVAIQPNYGGVIATTGDEQTAIGIYAVNRSQGGSVDYLVLNFTWSCPGPPPDTGEFDSDTMIVDSVRASGYTAGTTVTNTYMISGTLKGVVEKMDALYQLRDSIPR